MIFVGSSICLSFRTDHEAGLVRGRMVKCPLFFACLDDAVDIGFICDLVNQQT